MKAMMSLFLSLILLLGSFTYVPKSEAAAAPRAFDPARDCREGSCVDQLKGLFEAKLRDAHQSQCLPPSSTKNVRQWAESHTLSESCLSKLADLEALKHKLEAVAAYLSGLQDCANCGHGGAGASTPNLSAMLEDEAPQCTEKRKKEVMNQCDDDAMCVLVSGATFMLPQAIRTRMVPAHLQKQGCNGQNDSCLVQFATGFVKAVFTLFEGLFDLLKMAGRGVRNAASSLWSWMTGPEAHSSTAQLAAANASENEGVFRQLINDFPGTMGKIWNALLATIKQWLSHGVFCQQWSGTPQFSNCTKPAEGFGCTSCKAMINGMCSLTGTIMSEVVPAFLTGGLSVAAKYGAEGAVRLARLIRVPARTMEAVRASRVSRFIVRTGEAASTAIKTSRVTTAAIAASKAALNAIAPSIRALGETLSSMREAMRVAGTYIMQTKAGPVLIVGTNVAKGVGRTLLLPIDNALFRRSFDLGARSMTQMVRSGGAAVRLARNGVIAARTGTAVDPIESAFVKMELVPTGGNQRAYVDAVKVGREGRVSDALKAHPDMSFQQLVEDYYPDLDYGKFSSLLTPDGIETAERDLFKAISALPEGPQKARLIRDYQNHVSSAARSGMTALKTVTPENILANASLPADGKVDKALEISGVNSSAPNAQRLKDGIRNAQNVPTSGALHETADEIRAQVKALTDAGFTDAQAHKIVRSGAVSTARTEDMYPALKSVIVPDVSPQMVQGMSRSPAYIEIFEGVEEARRPAVARALKILEEDGSSADKVAATYKKFEPHFKRVQQGAAKASDPESMLAQFIRKRKQAGRADADIERELNEAFRTCK